MDLVDFAESVFNEIKADYVKFSENLDSTNFHFIPMSALTGDNVVNPSEQMPWYDGGALMPLLENVEITGDKNYSDFRFPVQYWSPRSSPLQRLHEMALSVCLQPQVL